MQTGDFKELFPLFSAANSDTLDWLLSISTEHEYPSDRAVLMEDAWGNAVYFVESGWVKVRRHTGEEVETLAILGKGDFFGEMAILDESPRSTDVVALSEVKLLSVSAQRFIQTLFKDSQLHHRMLQLMVQRLRHTNIRFQTRNQPAAVKLANTLTFFSQQYGFPADQGNIIFNIPYQDLADVTGITLDEVDKIMEKLIDKGWITISTAENQMHLVQAKQLAQLAERT